MPTNDQVNKHTGKVNHGTPQWLFDILDDELHFVLDVCADDTNKKCINYYSEGISGLDHRWAESNFCNPPYGRVISDWVYKAIHESNQLSFAFDNNMPTDSTHCKKTVMLLPSRTDTKWFHLLLENPNTEFVFIPGRLKFEVDRVEMDNSAQFPSLLVFFNCDPRSIKNVKQKIYDHQKRRKHAKKSKVRTAAIF